MFLVPPQVNAWGGAAAPAWARSLDGARPYDWVRAAGAAFGLTDDYVLFGLLVAPAFALYGVPLLGVARVIGRPTALLAFLNSSRRAGVPVE